MIDAPAESERIISKLNDTEPRFILLTHDHMDHVGALAVLRNSLGVPLAAHAQDSHSISPASETFLNDGDIIKLGNLELITLHTPGHTPGSLCFLTGEIRGITSWRSHARSGQ